MYESADPRDYAELDERPIIVLQQVGMINLKCDEDLYGMSKAKERDFASQGET